MELKNDFVVDRPVDEAWKILTDLELIAPCLPGAQLQEVEGEEYRGTVSVKVGPITGKYKGKARFVEQDEANHVAKLRAEGRDPRQGNANALITAAMVAAGGDGTQTRVDLTTDLGLSGKIASFARGNLEDVSRKLLEQFAKNLEAMLGQQGVSGSAAGGADQPAGGPAVPADVVPAPDTATGAATATSSTTPGATDSGTSTVPAGGGPGGADSAPGTITQPGGSDRAPAAPSATPPPVAGGSPAAAPAEPPTERPTVRKIDAPEAQPIDLLAVGGADALSKKLAPVAGVLVLVLLVRWLLRRRAA